MTNNDIEYIVSQTIKAQKKESSNWQSWIKLIVMVVFVPILTVYSSFRVIQWRVNSIDDKIEKIEICINDKVDAVWYERYIVGQKELIDRLEASINEGDAELELKINEVKLYLDKLVKEKKLYYRDNS